MSDQVLRLEDILQTNKDSSDKEINSDAKKKKKKAETRKKNELNIPRGVPASGRTWKSQKKRFSSIIKTRGYKAANKFEKLQVLKKELSRARELTKNIVEERKKKIEEKKQRRKFNLQRKEANRLKAEIVQVIKNPAKIKRMRKKQLRNIEKRDTLKLKK